MKLARLLLVLSTTCLLAAPPTLPLDLPPAASGGATLADALMGRKTIRTLGGPGLTLAEAGQLLWAAQGENRDGRRTVPSAHAKYPLKLYLLTAGSDSLAAGFYLYQSAGNKLLKQADFTPAATLEKVKGMQSWISAAPAVFVVAGVPTQMDPTGKGDGLTLTYYEGGAAAQDLLLQAVALGLDAGTAAGLDMAALGQALNLASDTRILTVLPVGREKSPNS
jgi:SagB-type dehydrogenase family enzyme